MDAMDARAARMYGDTEDAVVESSDRAAGHLFGVPDDERMDVEKLQDIGERVYR